MGENNKDYIRKHVDTIILRSLSESDSYGYDILKEIESKSNGVYVVKQPTLYNSLKRLEKIGYISSYEGDISQGGKRRYYTLTELGRKILEKETAEWEFSRTLMSRLLSDKEYDLDSPPPYDPNELRPMTKRNVTVSDNPASTNYVGNVAVKNEEPLENRQYQSISFKKVEEPLIKEEVKQLPIDIYLEKPAQKEYPADKVKEEQVISKKYINSNLDKKQEVENLKMTRGYQLLYGKEPIENKEDKQENPIKDTIETPAVAFKESLIPLQMSLKDINEDKETPNIAQNSYNIVIPQRKDDKVNQLAKQKLGLSSFESFKEEIKNTPVNEKIVLTPSKVEKPEDDRVLYEEKPIDGMLLSSKQVRKTRREVEPLMERPLSENEVFKNNVQYRPALDDLFNNRTSSDVNGNENDNNGYEIPAFSNSFNSIKNKFKAEGIKLRPYSKTNTANYYLSGFIYSNQINRDCVTALYFLIVVEILSIYFFANHLLKLSLNNYITIAAGLILIPISFWIVYAVNPNKRIKAKFDFKVSILTSLMIFFNLLIVIMLVGFFPFKADITDIDTMILPIIIPALLILNIPLTSIVYSLLYYSKRYHLR